ncbi:hypothetical protein D512_08888 [Burkholderia pseudomallei MSHR1043]|nr:hypothetical protein D512_08888 [Burkholderia pseudomallei MSHR1043]
MMLAHQLASKLFGEVVRGDVRITLLSDSPEHCYEPAFMCVAFGAFFRDKLARDERSLLRPEIAFVVDRATHFDFAAQRVHATSGKCYGYDHLVIATGCVPSPERIEGLAEAGDHFYPYEPARRLAERIAPIERGTVFVTVTFPKMHNMPHQCGIAPIETTLMLDDLLRRRGVRERVEIVYTYPTVSQLLRNCLFLQKPTCDALPARRGIGVLLRALQIAGRPHGEAAAHAKRGRPIAGRLIAGPRRHAAARRPPRVIARSSATRGAARRRDSRRTSARAARDAGRSDRPRATARRSTRIRAARAAAAPRRGPASRPRSISARCPRLPARACGPRRRRSSGTRPTPRPPRDAARRSAIRRAAARPARCTGARTDRRAARACRARRDTQATHTARGSSARARARSATNPRACRSAPQRRRRAR